MRFNHVAINVDNLEESVGFYTKFLGFVSDRIFIKPLEELRFTFLEKDGFRIELFEFQDVIRSKDDPSLQKVLGLRHIAFEVDSVTDTKKKLGELGLQLGPIKDGTSCKYFAFAEDPNGVAIEFYEPNS